MVYFHSSPILKPQIINKPFLLLRKLNVIATATKASIQIITVAEDTWIIR